MQANTMKILSIVAVALVMFGVAACNVGGSIGLPGAESVIDATGGDDGGDAGGDGDGGGGAVDDSGDDTVLASSYIYGGGMTKGEALRIEVDVPDVGRINARNLETDEENAVRYTKLGDYYVYELATEEYGRGWIQPGGFLGLMEPSTEDSDLVMAMAIDPAITDLTSYLGKNYVSINFKDQEDGVKFVLLEIEADGDFMIAEGDDISQPPSAPAAGDMNLLDFQYIPAFNCFVHDVNKGDSIETVTIFAREGVLFVILGNEDGFIIMVEQPSSTVPAEISVGDVFRGFEYKRSAEVDGAENYESTLTVTDRPSDDSIVLDYANPTEGNNDVALTPIGVDWPGFFGVDGESTGMIFLGPDVLIFADNRGDPWHYSYGIAFRE